MGRESERGPHAKRQARAPLPPSGRGERRRRRHGGSEKVRGPETGALATLSAEISTAARFARWLPAPVPPDAAMCKVYGDNIEVRCDVRPEDPELAVLVMMSRTCAHWRQFDDAAAVRRLELARMFEAEEEKERTYFEQHPDAVLALGVPSEALPPRSVVGIATAFAQWQATRAKFIAWLRHPDLPPRKPARPGPRADTVLIRTAHAVDEWLRRQTGRPDWNATVMILRCYRADRSRITVQARAAQLEDQVRRARERGQLA